MYINSFSDHIRRRFGQKLYKLSLDGGMSCPNRDGTRGTRGCIFCLNGSAAFAEGRAATIDEQIERAKARVAFKAKGCGYIAYLQSGTNTYAPADKLRELFFPLAQRDDIDALAIATRPDCLPGEVLELISELNAIKPTWVELGLQTIHEQSTRYIRRAYPLAVFDEAARALRLRGIEFVVHIILGLPGETPEMMYRTAEYVAQSGAGGIKLQLLHVLRGTDLAIDYAEGKFSTLSLEEYIEILEGCIRRLPPEMVIHRFTGDGAKKDLLAPEWSADKKRVLGAIMAAFERDNLMQGELYKCQNLKTKS